MHLPAAAVPTTGVLEPTENETAGFVLPLEVVFDVDKLESASFAECFHDININNRHPHRRKGGGLVEDYIVSL